MIFAQILGFVVLALVSPVIAAPVDNEASDITFKSSNRISIGVDPATTAGEITATSFVGGTCKFENRLVQECAQPDNRHDDPNSWYMLTSTSIRMVIDGAGHSFIVNLNKGVLDQYHGYDIYKFGPHVLTVEFSGREIFKYGEQSWDEFTRKNGHSAWCEQEKWSKGPLDCMKDKSTKSYRTLDMVCYFAC